MFMCNSLRRLTFAGLQTWARESKQNFIKTPRLLINHRYRIQESVSAAAQSPSFLVWNCFSQINLGRAEAASEVRIRVKIFFEGGKKATSCRMIVLIYAQKQNQSDQNIIASNNQR